MVRRSKSMLLTVAMKRSKSFNTSMNALRFIAEYGDYIEHERSHFGRVPSAPWGGFDIEGYGRHFGYSRAQAFRRQKAFRTCFPKDDFETLWGIVRPILEASNFKNEGPYAQAVYIGSIKATFTEP